MDRLEAMSIVLAVAEAGSLAAAARRLNAPAATASRKITELESFLRVKLFDRSTRKLVLTDAGAAYVAGLKRVLADLSEVERTAAGEYTAPTGELIATSAPGIGRTHLMPVVAEFLEAYPNISMRLILTDRLLSLPEDQIDVALRFGALPDSRLVSRRIGWVRAVICASPAYLARRSAPQVPEDLAGHDCIVFEGVQTPTPTLWPFRRDDDDLMIAVPPRLTVASAHDAYWAAIAGNGLARSTSALVASAVAEGRLCTVLDEFHPPPTPLSLLYRSGPFMPVKLRAFIDFATPRLKARIAEWTDAASE